ncbi:MAG: putative CRISPR-associated protein [Zavarzinella sp.]
MSRPIILTTVGTSLFYPNLANLSKSLETERALPADRKQWTEEQFQIYETMSTAFANEDWQGVAHQLARLPADTRICGAEINSVHSLLQQQFATANAGIYLFHSDTEAGNNIVAILAAYFRLRGHDPVETRMISGLQDSDPQLFRTRGLKNLARSIGETVRTYSSEACAINATGGYKAQIAIAVLLGQAIGIPVYYMHERFSEIISFPPMPVALDFSFWMKYSGLLTSLEKGVYEKKLFTDELDEKLDSLINSEQIDGRDYLELSATGQIFQETFRHRFRTDRTQILPPACVAKKPNQIEKAGWPGTFPRAIRFMEEVTTEIPQVIYCKTRVYNPDLAEPTRFRLKHGEIEGIFTDGSRTVKFEVKTTANTENQHLAVLAALNQWLMER